MKTYRVKTIGQRNGAIKPTWQEANRWLYTIRDLRQKRGICPKGIYRFKSFEEADECMMNMLVKSSREIQQ